MKKLLVNMLWMTTILMTTWSCQQKEGVVTLDQMVDQATQVTQAVSVEQLYEKIDQGDMLLLIDVREPAEFNAGYIPGAVNIPRGVLEFKIGSTDFWDAAMLYMPEKDEEIVVYCKKGKRSILAAKALQDLGYTHVTYLTDGWKGWEMTYPLIYEKNLDHSDHGGGGESGGC